MTQTKGFAARTTAVRVVDGDSVECDFKGQRTRVRLYGIDAPELAQPYGAEAAEGLDAIIRDSEPLMMTVMGEDQYRRTVGLLYSARTGARDSVNVRMVRFGHAYAYTRFGGAELGMARAQRDARASRRGLWRGGREGGERPWEFRKRSREGLWGSVPWEVKAWLMGIAAILLFLLVIVGWLKGWI